MGVSDVAPPGKVTLSKGSSHLTAMALDQAEEAFALLAFPLTKTDGPETAPT